MRRTPIKSQPDIQGAASTSSGASLSCGAGPHGAHPRMRKGSDLLTHAFCT